MTTYYITFGQKSPFRNGWVELETEGGYDQAMEMANTALGGNGSFSMLYHEFDFNPKFFKDGKIGLSIK